MAMNISSWYVTILVLLSQLVVLLVLLSMGLEEPVDMLG